MTVPGIDTPWESERFGMWGPEFERCEHCGTVFYLNPKTVQELVGGQPMIPFKLNRGSDPAADVEYGAEWLRYLAVRGKFVRSLMACCPRAVGLRRWAHDSDYE